MNKTAQRHVNAIMDAETAYLNSTGTALLEYRQRKNQIHDAAKAYKDEQAHVDKYLPEAKSIARDALTRAEHTLKSAIKSNLEGLKRELQTSINQPIPQGFTERISLYRAAALAPSRTEAEALLQMAGKNPLAIRAVAKLLDDMKAPVRVDSRSIDQYEADLDTLAALAEQPLLHCPNETYSELSEVMKGEPMPTRTANGYVNIGNTWDSTALLVACQIIPSQIRSIEKNADAWSADVTYQLREREHAAEVAKSKEEAENAGEEYTPDREPVSTTGIADRGTDGVELAAAMGRRLAENAATAARTIEACTR